MFFQYHNNNYCVNCDWLQFSVKLPSVRPEFQCPEGYRLEINQGNNIFKHRAILFDHNGVKYLTLLWEPYSRVLDDKLMTVQLANQLLYTGEIHHAWRLLQAIVPCEFNSIGRVDICCDFEIDDWRLDFIKHLNSGHYYTERKKEGSVFWHEASKDDFIKKQLHCLSWGSKTSEIKVKLYNKSREQGLVGEGVVDGEGVVHELEPEKPWIVSEWVNNGMDKKLVWRLEFSLSGAGQLRYNDKPISLDNIADPQWLLGVFIDMYHTRFVTRINQGRRKGHKNLDTRVFLIDLPTDGERLKWAESDVKQEEVEPAITVLRSLMNGLDNPFILSSRANFEAYWQTIIQVIAGGNLYGYFCRTFNESPQAYFEHLLPSVGEGISERIVSPSKYFN